MRKAEFLQYFAKDPKTGDYREGVIEPPGGRKQWLQERIEDFSSGSLDEGAYQEAGDKDYDDLAKRSAAGQVAHDIGKAADFMGQPYTPWGMKPIPVDKKK